MVCKECNIVCGLHRPKYKHLNPSYEISQAVLAENDLYVLDLMTHTVCFQPLSSCCFQKNWFLTVFSSPARKYCFASSSRSYLVSVAFYQFFNSFLFQNMLIWRILSVDGHSGRVTKDTRTMCMSATWLEGTSCCAVIKWVWLCVSEQIMGMRWHQLPCCDEYNQQ